MSETTSTDRRQSAIAGAEAEHLGLRGRLDALEALRDLDEISTAMSALLQQLNVHFSAEEADDGVFSEIGRIAPWQDRKLQRLIGEHMSILARARGLRDQADALVTGPIAQLHTELGRLVADLRRHEAVEAELIEEARRDEIGVGD